jgi:gamma-glutamylcyclotransferase (GGCT)/AIG2-like uncharacterized protein YtfP
VSHHVFVYGTLRPGDVRWPLLRPFVVDEGWPDEVGGQLFDTGLDYPAAVFDAGHTGWVVGHTFTLLDHDADRALAVLDEEEDTVLGLYRRVRVTTRRGVGAWAYAYGSGLELTLIRSGDWFRREAEHEQ